MLILLNTNIKTSLVLLLFIFNGFYSQANNIHWTESTVINKDDQFEFPKVLMDAPINFQINSAINYLNVSSFKRNVAKIMFYQAWLMEQELQSLSLQTDSLRLAYSKADSDHKEAISAQILTVEKRVITLNDEIPAMYQKAREEEDIYWQSATIEEIARFEKKNKLYKDSIQQSIAADNAATFIEITDTLHLDQSLDQSVEKKAVVVDEIVFKIQVCSYKINMPEAAKKMIKKLSLIRKVDKHVDDKGVTIYTTGNLKSYKEAVVMQSQVKQEGVKNPKISAYLKGKMITIDEARKINKEL